MTHVTVIRTNGTESTHQVAESILFIEVARLIGADVLDFVNLHDGRTMAVNDVGHQNGLPDNAKGTALYHSVCRPGTTNRIVGDVAVLMECHQ